MHELTSCARPTYEDRTNHRSELVGVIGTRKVPVAGSTSVVQKVFQTRRVSKSSFGEVGRTYLVERMCFPEKWRSPIEEVRAASFPLLEQRDSTDEPSLR